MTVFIILIIVGAVFIGWLIAKWPSFFQLFEKKENTVKEDVAPVQKQEEQNALLQVKIDVLEREKEGLQNKNDQLARENSQLASKVNQQKQLERVQKFEVGVGSVQVCR
jgi:hypothetical protein